MAQTFTVFLCSTQIDLLAEREAVLNAIRSLKQRHNAMEFFGAHADAPIAVCLEQVRTSDILIVIVGHRYGSLVSDLGISYSQAEYEEALRHETPCLVYFRSEGIA